MNPLPGSEFLLRLLNLTGKDYFRPDVSSVTAEVEKGTDLLPPV